MQRLLRRNLPISRQRVITCDCIKQLFASVCSSVFYLRVARSSIYSTTTTNSDTQTKDMAVTRTNAISKQKFDYLLVLDFEATCDNKSRLIPQEIIEFPCLKVNAKTLQIESQFHQYVQPQVHKQITPFCTELTGIIQDMVDGKPHLKETLEAFHEWMLSEGLMKDGVSSIFVTCGDWDLKTMLPSQCKYFNIQPHPVFSRWINIKKSFANLTGVFPRGMMGMLSKLNIPHKGRHHSGIDDCKNIASILITMIQQGHIFQQTSHPEKL
ncbi:ERI1 exoribonuclease 3-like [Gigantopelta aegis]|uniref:ERI1 exoribonuclease 3-like n=1 Tax=Gigantopelta aegis TaxID=1735272 RepID=UPI001B88A81D|nr:ERI1 exoribonuclease 3-like [Gigantopelta aegis]